MENNKTIPTTKWKNYADLDANIKVVDVTALHLMTMTMISSATSNKLMML